MTWKQTSQLALESRSLTLLIDMCINFITESTSLGAKICRIAPQDQPLNQTCFWNFYINILTNYRSFIDWIIISSNYMFTSDELRKKSKEAVVGKNLSKLRTLVLMNTKQYFWSPQTTFTSRGNSGSTVSDYGLDDRSSIPDRRRGFFF
jgi:hypothetical protein